MKRYLIAALAALVIFPAAAFAASLNVDGSVVQAGTDTDLTCADNAVVGWTTQTVFSGEFAVTRVTVDFDAGCDGNYAYVAIFSGPGAQTGFGIGPIAGDQVTFDVDESAVNAEVDNIDMVSVAVKNTNDGDNPATPLVEEFFYSAIITGP